VAVFLFCATPNMPSTFGLLALNGGVLHKDIQSKGRLKSLICQSAAASSLEALPELAVQRRCTCRANKLSSAQEVDDIDERGRDPKYEDRPYDSVEAAVQEPMSSHRAPELTFHRSTPSFRAP
jgi:hypothetical protein